LGIGIFLHGSLCYGGMPLLFWLGFYFWDENFDFRFLSSLHNVFVPYLVVLFGFKV
jgi:hypothetical protein